MSGAGTKPGLLDGPEQLLGTRVLDFELESVIGSGGMSVVYRGKHRITAHEVAVKVLPPELAIHDELKARFVEEARVLAVLEHPNIVQLNNLTESGGRLCLVMQFVDGPTLEKRILDGGPQPAEEVIRIGIEVLDALAHAHQQGVVHRDIKPSNVLLRNDGRVKVTDFGIAKMLGSSRLTSQGQTMGTVRYMSPEQVRGRALDGRSDLYSLAITMFEGLTAHTPFDGESQFEIMHQQLHREAPKVAELNITVDARLQLILTRALEKHPEDRFPDAGTMAAALRGLLPEQTGARAAPMPDLLSPRRRRRRTAIMLGVATALVAAAGVGGWNVLRRRPQSIERRQVAPPVAASGSGQAQAWPAPHALPRTRLGADTQFLEEKLRVQAVSAIDPSTVRALYREMLGEWAAFVQATPALSPSLVNVPPMNLVVVPEALLSKPELWPGYTVDANTAYSSRYIDSSSTLFLGESAIKSKKDLAYNLALHALAADKGLPTAKISESATLFENRFSR